MVTKDDDQEATADEVIDGPEPIPHVWHDYVPGILLLIPMVVAFFAMFFEPDRMLPWAISRAAISAGNLKTVQLHMFAHGSIVHIAMNGIALYALAPVVTQRLGSGFRASILVLVLFELSGLGGAAAFLVLHQWNDTPMLGASGAIYGLVGFLVRYPQIGAQIVPIWSKEMLKTSVELVKDNFKLFLYFGLPPLLMGRAGGLAWEAHLGGFIVGLLLCPFLLLSATKTQENAKNL